MISDLLPWRRDRPAECGVADGFVLILAAAQPADLACRDEPTRRIAFRCDAHGEQTRDVCDFHERAGLETTAVCARCAGEGRHVPITFLRSGPNPAMTATATEA